MSIVQQSLIKEIAREIALGNTCYIHQTTKIITTIDNSTEDQKIIEAQIVTQAELEHKIENYLKLEKPGTEDQLIMREYFLEEIPDKSIRKQLSNALKRKNPIRNFNQFVEGDMELNQHWRNFKVGEYLRWVSNFIADSYNH